MLLIKRKLKMQSVDYALRDFGIRRLDQKEKSEASTSSRRRWGRKITSMGLTYFSSLKSETAVMPVPVQTAPQPVVPAAPAQTDESKAGAIPK